MQICYNTGEPLINRYRFLSGGEKMPSEMELKAKLIDDYELLITLRKSAVKENAVETVKLIDEKIGYLKLKLQPMELPNDPTKE